MLSPDCDRLSSMEDEEEFLVRQMPSDSQAGHCSLMRSRRQRSDNKPVGSLSKGKSWRRSLWWRLICALGFLSCLQLQIRTCDAVVNWWYLGMVEERPSQALRRSTSSQPTMTASGPMAITGVMAGDDPSGGSTGGHQAVFRTFCGQEDRELAEWEKEVCNNHPFLAQLDSNSLRSVSLGALKGIRECRSQFASERWNCPTYPNTTSVFGVHTMKRGSKETAYIYAVTSAGVVHAVTAACGAGELAECSCDAERNGGRTTEEGWKWGGCSAEIGYGRDFAKKLVDYPDEVRLASANTRRGVRRRAAMNLLNNEAGRVAVASLMKNQCRCHGISGSCELKTCWRSLPPFHEVGARLKDRYENSVAISQIDELPFKSRAGTKKKKRKRRNKQHQQQPAAPSSPRAASLVAVADDPLATPANNTSNNFKPFSSRTDLMATGNHNRNKKRRSSTLGSNSVNSLVFPLKITPAMTDKLVYIHESLDYCEGDRKRQIPSTSGRRCSKDSTKGDSCDVLCCGRGYNTQIVRQVERCNCKFFWCCSVKCQTCDTLIDVHTCK